MQGSTVMWFETDVSVHKLIIQSVTVETAKCMLWVAAGSCSLGSNIYNTFFLLFIVYRELKVWFFF